MACGLRRYSRVLLCYNGFRVSSKLRFALRRCRSHTVRKSTRALPAELAGAPGDPRRFFVLYAGRDQTGGAENCETRNRLCRPSPIDAIILGQRLFAGAKPPKAARSASRHAKAEGHDRNLGPSKWLRVWFRALVAVVHESTSTTWQRLPGFRGAPPADVTGKAVLSPGSCPPTAAGRTRTR